VRGLLDALARQSIGTSSFEVVIADDGSTDAALDSVEAGPLELRIVRGPRTSSYAARNRGAADARAAVLAFTDADCRPAPDWLERGLAALDTADVAAGAVHFAPAGRVGVWGLLDMDAYLDQERMVRNDTAATANLIVTRAAYDRVDGFDPTLASNGDHDFVRRCVGAGLRLAFAPDAQVRHPVRDSGREFMRKWWRTQRAYGARCARDGSGDGRTWQLLVPGLRTWRSRRWHGRPAGLDRARLAASGVRPGPLQRAAALILLYLILPLSAFAAQMAGRRSGRQMAARRRVAVEVETP
jgi:glycosyltransferase involved in cell wall biosynthesis